MKKQRIDLLLVERGFATSRQRAQALIMAGAVLANDKVIDKAGTQIATDANLRLRGNPLPYVSRGGCKLEHALDCFGIEPAGLQIVDIGISTGGFTDCLLQRGAAHVTGIDVGRGQVAWSLQQDERVTLFEGENIRHFNTARLTHPVDLVVVDVSFISLSLVMPVVAEILKSGGRALPMVKPQFEVGREAIGKKGVVRDEAARLAAVEKIRLCAVDLGFEFLGETPSPLPGPEGNIEYFLYLSKPGC
jgi:23S rRNA (cytidine1920-2'-O)/16S rRNA (cytidine1409-2'-O)-methyltransferase